jgi:hypothetical protein
VICTWDQSTEVVIRRVTSRPEIRLKVYEELIYSVCFIFRLLLMEYRRITIVKGADHHVVEIRSAIPGEDMVWSDYRFVGDLEF